MLGALPGDAPPPPAPARLWDPAARRAPASPELVVQTLTALARIDGALAERALDRIEAHPATYGMDGVLLPAALALGAASPAGPEPSAVTRLRRAVIAHLDARIALPLEPPADLSRPTKLDCPCADCQGLARFLASPLERVWKLKSAEGKRRHLTAVAQRNRCDLDLATDTRGRPHTLVCTKNQASYEGRVRQRAQDLEHRGALGG